MSIFGKLFGTLLLAFIAGAGILLSVGGAANRAQQEENVATTTTARSETASSTEKSETLKPIKAHTVSELQENEGKTASTTPLPSVPVKQKASATRSARAIASSTKSSAESVTRAEREPALPWSEVNTRARAALVNIICTTKDGGLFKPITGSGVIIDPRGVILTNAHVAEYFLLRDFPDPNFVNCTVRAGNPAISRYRAELLYLSPSWLNDNYKNITEETPKETGENDYALLLITGSTDPTARPVPETFPFLPMETDDTRIIENEQVLLAAYPAGFLGGIATERDLYSVGSIGRVGTFFTFTGKTVDAIGVDGSLLAQQGSSGGAAVDDRGKLVGVIVTASVDQATTEERTLNAITLSHIARVFKKEGGFAFTDIARSNLALLEAQFEREIAPELRRLLIAEIRGDR